jgi:hypothetical protein
MDKSKGQLGFPQTTPKERMIYELAAPLMKAASQVKRRKNKKRLLP